MEGAIVYSASADRDLDRLDPQVARRILATVRRYAETGGGDVRRLTAGGGALRLRVGDWRVRFHERSEARESRQTASEMVHVRIIEVVRVRHHGVAYDDL